MGRVVSSFDGVRNIGDLAAVAHLDDHDALVTQHRCVKCNRACADGRQHMVARNVHGMAVFVLAHPFTGSDARHFVPGLLFGAMGSVVFKPCGQHGAADGGGNLVECFQHSDLAAALGEVFGRLAAHQAAANHRHAAGPRPWPGQ